MNILIGFLNELEKDAFSWGKEGLPRGIAKGITGAGATLLYGAALYNAMKALKKEKGKAKAGDIAKAMGIGGMTAFGKGYAEGAIEALSKRMLKVK